MKAKASPSQMKRSARQHFDNKQFIRKDQFTSPEWPAVLAELANELGLVCVHFNGLDVLVTREVARTMPKSVGGKGKGTYKPSSDSLAHHESFA